MFIYRRQEDPIIGEALIGMNWGQSIAIPAAIALPPFPVRLAEIEQFLEQQKPLGELTKGL